MQSNYFCSLCNASKVNLIWLFLLLNHTAGMKSGHGGIQSWRKGRTVEESSRSSASETRRLHDLSCSSRTWSTPGFYNQINTVKKSTPQPFVKLPLKPIHFKYLIKKAQIGCSLCSSGHFDDSWPQSALETNFLFFFFFKHPDLGNKHVNFKSICAHSSFFPHSFSFSITAAIKSQRLQATIKVCKIN